MAGLEGLDDGHKRVSLGLVALEAADLQREPGAVHEQSHDNLRVDPALLGEPGLAQVVFLLGLEVQRRHVIEHQRNVSAAACVSEARGGDQVPVAAVMGALERALARRERRRHSTQVSKDPVDVEQGGGLNDPRDDQVPKGLIGHDVEAEVVEDSRKDLIEQPGEGAGHPWGTRRPAAGRWWLREKSRCGRLGQQRNVATRGVQAQIKLHLSVVDDQPVGFLQEHRQRDLVVG